MKRKRLFALMLSGTMLLAALAGCAPQEDAPTEPSGEQTEGTIPAGTGNAGEVQVTLDNNRVLVNGAAVEDTPILGVYCSKDIVYYEDRDFYESGNPYGEGTEQDRHTQQEADNSVVVNITQPGTYRLRGTWPDGQIRIDLGQDAKTDETAVVNLILDTVELSCQVAPAILFLNVYECEGEATEETAQPTVDTSKAGANLILAENSTNLVTGSYVAKIYKDNPDGKKLWKQDGAIYSYMSMNVDGEGDGSGTLRLTARKEGLDTERHLTINGGWISIFSQDDGINTNEDGVSVTTINGGTVHIVAGLGSEGDGIDSNGWLVINGGTVISSANPASDAGLDSDMGSYVNGGTVVALGSTMDWAESDSNQVTMNLQFVQNQNPQDALVVTDEDGNVVFGYCPELDEQMSAHLRQYRGAVISSPNFQVGDRYQVFAGGQLTGENTLGVFGKDAMYQPGTLQSYTGTDVGRGGFGGMRPEGGLPVDHGKDWPEGERPTMPDGQMPPKPGDGWGQRPERDPGQIPPEGPAPDPGDPGQSLEQPSTVFYMQDKVNGFSGITSAQDGDSIPGA